MVQITFLEDHADVIPTLAQWFRDQWPDYYAQRTLTDIEQDFHTDLNQDRLPVRLVAFDAGELVGTIVLRRRALDTYREYQPGLGGLYVVGPHRGRGIGTELVRAGMAVAQGLGYDVVYTSTGAATGILERLAWVRIKAVQHHGEQLTLYRCVLDGVGPTSVPADAARG